MKTGQVVIIFSLIASKLTRGAEMCVKDTPENVKIILCTILNPFKTAIIKFLIYDIFGIFRRENPGGLTLNSMRVTWTASNSGLLSHFRGKY